LFKFFNIFITHFLYIIYLKFINTYFVWKNDSKFFIEGFFICFFIIFLFSIFAYLLKILQYEFISLSELSINNVWKSLLFVIIINNIFVAVGEEIVFRGFILTFLITYLKNWKLSIIISAIVFSLGHIHYNALLPFITALFGGLVLGYCFYKSNSLFFPVGIHFGWNFANSIFALNDAELAGYEWFVKRLNFGYFFNLGKTVELFELFSILIIFLILVSFKKNLFPSTLVYNNNFIYRNLKK